MYAPFGYGLDIKSRKYCYNCSCSWLSYYNSAIRIVRPYLLHEPGSKFGREVAQSGPSPLRTAAIYSRGGLHDLRFFASRARNLRIWSVLTLGSLKRISRNGVIEPRPNSSVSQCPYNALPYCASCASSLSHRGHRGVFTCELFLASSGSTLGHGPTTRTHACRRPPKRERGRPRHTHTHTI